jgi:putative tricarboxylic transport membrane protein
MAMFRVKDRDTFATGAFLMLVALAALYFSWPLRSWSSVGLGPGYVPKMFAVILLALGAAIAVAGLRWTGEPAERWHPRPLLMILASIGFFALTIERLGMGVALAGLVLIGCGAHRETRVLDALALAAGAVLLAWLVFQKALGLPITLWPSFG